MSLVFAQEEATVMMFQVKKMEIVQVLELVQVTPLRLWEQVVLQILRLMNEEIRFSHESWACPLHSLLTTAPMVTLGLLTYLSMGK